jgi:N-methylhydantoinase B
VAGGAGGGPFADGAEGCGANFSFLKNTPVEINEAEVPITIRRYGLVPDSGGPGRYRGGSALEMEFQVFAPQTMVTARNRDRSVIVRLGAARWTARRSLALRAQSRHRWRDRAWLAGHRPLRAGDIILIQGPGAGGYGSPLERPIADVVTDVRRGLVSAERARADYGVVIGDDLSVDEAATAKLRGELASEADRAEFGHGPGRTAFEKVWTRARYEALTRILAAVPVTWRFFVKQQIFRAVTSEPTSETQGVADVYRAYEALIARCTDLPPVASDSAAAAA